MEFEIYEDELENENDIEEVEEEIIKTPIYGLDPNELEIGYKINGKIDKCSCGKEIQTYYIVQEAIRSRKSYFGDVKVRERYKQRYWEYKNYPELYCHCKCGKAWDDHLSDNVKKEIKNEL